MTHSVAPLIADQLVGCIANDRDPTVGELFAVAERLWTEGSAGRSAFAWGRLPPDSIARPIALRAAQLALSGSSDPLPAQPRGEPRS